MPIRFIISPHDSRRKAISLVELAYGLLIIGFILAFVWLAAATMYRKYDVMQADKELNVIVGSLRLAHPAGKIGQDEDLDMLGLPPGFTNHPLGQSFVFNPWHGNVSTFSGNAMGWGRDASNDDFTIRFDSVPKKACADFIMDASTPAMRGLGLIAVYISPAPLQGHEMCLGSDSYCLNPVPSLIRTQVEAYCNASSIMTLMFTFNSH
jgi:hypothetical protein